MITYSLLHLHPIFVSVSVSVHFAYAMEIFVFIFCTSICCGSIIKCTCIGVSGAVGVTVCSNALQLLRAGNGPCLDAHVFTFPTHSTDMLCKYLALSYFRVNYDSWNLFAEVSRSADDEWMVQHASSCSIILARLMKVLFICYVHWSIRLKEIISNLFRYELRWGGPCVYNTHWLNVTWQHSSPAQNGRE